MPARTSTELIAAVKRRCFWPTSNAPFTDAEILSIATEELRADLYRMFLEVRSEVYEASTDITLTAGTHTYRLPADAGMQVRDVLYVNSSGYELQLDRLAKDRLGYLDQSGTGQPVAFILDGHRIRLFPTPGKADSVRIKFRWLPDELTETGTTIASVGASSITLAATVSGFSDGTPDSYAIYADHGAHNKLWEGTATYASGGPSLGTITDAYRDWDDAAVGARAGDSVAQDGYSYVPQVPAEGYKLLVLKTALAALMAHEPQGNRATLATLTEMEEAKLRDYLERRVDGEAETHVNDAGALGWM